MEINDLLKPDDVLSCFRASSKKQTLQTLGHQLSDSYGLDRDSVFDALVDREKLGSTGVGKGVAIPHARVDGLDRIVGLFAHLHTPVDFDSIDDQPVDLIFMMLAPVDAGADHLKALARVSRLLRDNAVCQKMRAVQDTEALRAILSPPTSNVA